MAAAIQGLELGNIRPFTAQITPLNFVGRHTGVLGHVINKIFKVLVEPVKKGNSRYHFLTGSTG